MPRPPQYSDLLTAAERELGFELIEVNNHGRFSNEPERIKAVVRRVSQYDRIVKLNYDSGVRYQLERFGRHDLGAMRNDNVGWQPNSRIAGTPEEAIEWIRSGGDLFGRPSVPIIAMDPGDKY